MHSRADSHGCTLADQPFPHDDDSSSNRKKQQQRSHNKASDHSDGNVLSDSSRPAVRWSCLTCGGHTRAVTPSSFSSSPASTASLLGDCAGQQARGSGCSGIVDDSDERENNSNGWSGSTKELNKGDAAAAATAPAAAPPSSAATVAAVGTHHQSFCNVNGESAEVAVITAGAASIATMATAAAAVSTSNDDDDDEEGPSDRLRVSSLTTSEVNEWDRDGNDDTNETAIDDESDADADVDVDVDNDNTSGIDGIEASQGAAPDGDPSEAVHTNRNSGEPLAVVLEELPATKSDGGNDSNDNDNERDVDKRPASEWGGAWLSTANTDGCSGGGGGGGGGGDFNSCLHSSMAAATTRNTNGCFAASSASKTAATSTQTPSHHQHQSSLLSFLSSLLATAVGLVLWLAPRRLTEALQSPRVQCTLQAARRYWLHASLRWLDHPLSARDVARKERVWLQHAVRFDPNNHDESADDVVRLGRTTGNRATAAAHILADAQARAEREAEAMAIGMDMASAFSSFM